MTISWKVEIINPINNSILKSIEDISIQNICRSWKKETQNNYITSAKLFNIFHKKKKDGLVRVYKYDSKVSSSSDEED